MDAIQANKELKEFTKTEIIGMMQKYHDDLIAYAKKLRLQVNKGQEYQDGMEEQVAEKNGAIKIDGIWVERYPVWSVPVRITKILKVMKKDREKLLKDTDLKELLRRSKEPFESLKKV